MTKDCLYGSALYEYLKFSLVDPSFGAEVHVRPSIEAWSLKQS